MYLKKKKINKYQIFKYLLINNNILVHIFLTIHDLRKKYHENMKSFYMYHKLIDYVSLKKLCNYQEILLLGILQSLSAISAITTKVAGIQQLQIIALYSNKYITSDVKMSQHKR
jgi:hypothetical protein